MKSFKIIPAKGIASLMVVIVITAMTLLIAGVSAMEEISRARLRTHEQLYRKTLAETEGCLEKGLLKLKKNSAYAGGTETVEETACLISVTGIGQARTLRAMGSRGSYSEDLQAEVDWSADFKIMRWQQNN